MTVECTCDPPESGEEFCTGHCVLRAEIERLQDLIRWIVAEADISVYHTAANQYFFSFASDEYSTPDLLEKDRVQIMALGKLIGIKEWHSA